MTSAEERLWQRLDRIERRTGSVGDAIEVLQLIETHPLHAPSAVLQVAGVKGFVPSSSSSDRFLRETFLLALSAIHVGKQRVYEWNTRKLAKSVPRHQKVCALVGMKSERERDVDRAIKAYVATLERDPSALLIHKRQIALLKSQLLPQEAIAALNHYLSLYIADQTAWVELADLYVSTSSYSKALFCVSECMLQSPKNWSYCVRTGEIYFTLGGKDNLLKARHYFSKSVVINPRYNLRGLYGLWMTCTALQDSKQTKDTLDSKDSIDSKNDELLKFARDRLVDHSSTSCHPVSGAAIRGMVAAG